MIVSIEILVIEQVKHLKDYQLALSFNDGTERIIDFYPFLSQSTNPHINKYLDPKLFACFNLDQGDLEWNDYDLCFPIGDLYEGKI